MLKAVLILLLASREWDEKTRNFLKKTIASLTPATGFLKLTNGNFTCPKTDGKYSREYFALFFTRHLSRNIEDYDCDHDDVATVETDCHTQKPLKDVTFLQMYNRLTTIYDDESRIWWSSKDQIKAVIKANQDKFIKDGRCYFFFYKNETGKRSVFIADFSNGEWGLDLKEFEDLHVWNAMIGHEVVVPQKVPVQLEK